MMNEASSSSQSLGELLKAGVAAAQAGQRERARELLTRVVQMDDRSVTGWLWLSSVVDDLSNREMCLQHVLNIDPDNAPARRGLEKVRRQKADELLQAGIGAAQKGQRDHARNLLKQYVELDEKSAAAWLWLSSVVNTLEEREVCLENVLVLDPGNEAALRGLAQVREQIELEKQTAPKITLTPLAATSPATVEVGETASAATGVTVWPVTTRDEFDDEYLCPYCAAQTDPEDKRCPSCGAGLWVKRRRREERSSWFWVSWTLEIVLALVFVGAVILLPMVVSAIVHLNYGLPEDATANVHLGTILPVYLGMDSGLTADVEQVILDVLPRWIFFAVVGAAVFQVGVTVTMLLRWKPTWYFFLLSAVWGPITLVLALSRVGVASWICSGVIMLISFPIVLLAFQIQDDFFHDRTRILLKPDRDAHTGLDHLAHGSRYARMGMWAMAVVHLQRAVGAIPHQIETHLALASAYIKLRRFDRAADALKEAQRVSPDDPEVAKLLERARAG